LVQGDTSTHAPTNPEHFVLDLFGLLFHFFNSVDNLFVVLDQEAPAKKSVMFKVNG
jgi:hypothetical protein